MPEQQMTDHRKQNENEWCVGEPPARWDVSFGGLLAEMVRQMFWRDGGDRAVPEGEREPAPRRAA